MRYSLDAGHLECCEADHLGDDGLADGQARGHDAPFDRTAARRRGAGPGGVADSGSRRAEPAADNDSAMRSGTWARAVRAATSTANMIIRRLARPWVMITVPRTPSSGDPPTRS